MSAAMDLAMKMVARAREDEHRMPYQNALIALDDDNQRLRNEMTVLMMERDELRQKLAERSHP